MAEEVKLLGCWASPFCFRIEIALHLKGVQFEYIQEDIANKSCELLKYNPVHKKVPVLVHNGNSVVESLVILEYIDETWKTNPIFPQDPYKRSMARFWTRFIDDKCVPALWTAYWGKGEEQKKCIEEACQHLKTLEDELKDNIFFGGETIGPVDIAANFIAYLLDVFEEINKVQLLTQERFPKLHNWTIEFNNCSVIKKQLPPKDKLVGIYKAFYGTGSACTKPFGV